MLCFSIMLDLQSLSTKHILVIVTSKYFSVPFEVFSCYNR